MAEVDSAFIQPLEHRPKPYYTIEAQNIPVIDLSGLDSSLSGSVAQIGDACRDWGFFQVINHGVPSKCRENMESAARKFFALAKEEKRKVIRDKENPFGYYDSEHTKNVRDWKEVFDFAVENPVITPTLHDLDHMELKELFNKWPESLPELSNIIMVDQQQDVKKRGSYEQWSKEESDVLLEIMVDAVARGWRDNNGSLSKQTIEERILPVLNEKLGCQKTYNNYQSRLKWFKNRWNSFSTLMRFNSGFGFDSSTKRFTAPDEVWEDYIKAHPKDTDLRCGTFQDYEALEIAIGNVVAVGKKSIGLGSVTDARTLGVGEGSSVRIEDFDYDVDCDAFVRPTHNDPPSHSTSPLQSPEAFEIPMPKTTQNKRNRTEFEGNTSQSGIIERLDKISTSFEGIYSLLEKREREREYTIWDAIKDTPNLDEDTRFKAVELLDTKGKKDVFLKMSPEERSSWILHKMRGL